MTGGATGGAMTGGATGGAGNYGTDMGFTNYDPTTGTYSLTGGNTVPDTGAYDPTMDPLAGTYPADSNGNPFPNGTNSTHGGHGPYYNATNATGMNDTAHGVPHYGADGTITYTGTSTDATYTPGTPVYGTDGAITYTTGGASTTGTYTTGGASTVGTDATVTVLNKSSRR